MGIGVGLYVKNSAEAVEFYSKVFGLTLGYNVKNDDGSYYHSELYKNGEIFVCVVEGNGGNGSPVQLGVEMENAEEVKRAYELFCGDGAIQDMPVCELPWSPCAASVIDKYGVWWYFSCKSHKPDETFDPKKPLY